jgi:rSAM/selenodomain-associated transferase 2
VRSRLRDRGFRIHELPPTHDVDLPGDVDRLRDRLASDALLRAALPHTTRALAELEVARRAPDPRDAAGLALLSVIVPVLDEESRIGALLDELGGSDGIDETIVVDGGSADRTFEIAAARRGVLALRAPRGRALQMNAGAAAATGDILLFLHADARLPADAGRRVRETLAEPGVVAGAFRIRTVAERRGGWIRHFLPIADLRSRYSRLPYGDQAIFTRASDFAAVGGYPRQALMEDLELSRRLARRGRIRIDRGVVEVSARRFLARPIYTPLAINLFPLLYALGVSPETLARLYGNPR